MYKQLLAVVAFSLVGSAWSGASEDHKMVEVCKAECPSAKTEDEAHKCMDGVAKKKAGDKKFRKSDCYAAYREHEKHEKEDGHKH
ncbi:MAG: hypothetical protein AB7F66_13555 [Bacteriovoracia bacterium]